MRKLLGAVLGVLDHIERASGVVSIDSARAQKPLAELLEIATEVRLSSRDDVEPIVNGTCPPPPINWPHFSDVRRWSDVKRLMREGFDLVLTFDAHNHRPTYFLYLGEERAPNNNVIPQSAVVSADRRGQLPAPTKLSDGSFRYHFDQKASPKPRTTKGRKINAARV